MNDHVETESEAPKAAEHDAPAKADGGERTTPGFLRALEGGEAEFDDANLLDHNYDGIQEYDNPLPGWWSFLFWVSILFAFVYLGWAHLSPGRLVADEYARESKELAEFHRRGVRFRVIGRVEEMPARVRDTLLEHVEATKNNTDLTLNLALNYGGRTEIVDAVRAVARRVAAGELAPDEIGEEAIEENLYTGGMPDPDLLIRTGGDYRYSNFLLWQIAYSELYVTPTLWPDFDEAAAEWVVLLGGGWLE